MNYQFFLKVFYYWCSLRFYFQIEMTCSATLIFFARKYIIVGTIKINKTETVIFRSENIVSRLITPILSLKKMTFLSNLMHARKLEKTTMPTIKTTVPTSL